MAERTPLTECIAPSFYEIHHQLKKGGVSELWMRGGRGCFSGEQRIRTTRGPVPIQDIQIGDEVYTVNEETSKIEVKPVIDTFTYENVKETFEVWLRNGQRIVATGDHKFFQVGGCASLKQLLQQEAACGTVRSYAPLHQGCSNTPKELLGRLLNVDDIVSYREVEIAKVYDLSVQDNHNYMLDIGDGILVHNSTKSSFTSIEIILGILSDPEANAVVFRRYENEIRDSVFGQMQWALNKLNVDHEFKAYVSPFKIVYERTGQVVLFKGADNPKKIKSIKLPTGYMKYAWFEEVDQFSGMEEIRNIQQSIFRGTTKQQIAFYSYNPPKSARSWANAETKLAKPGRVVHYSDYLSVPVNWLGKTFLENAEHLRNVNPDAYEHEYLGKETGTGLEVFTNVTLRPITNKEISFFDHRSQGLDFGYAADPLCFLEGHFDAKKKILYLFDEISGVGIKNSEFAARLSEDQRAEVTMADSSEPKSIDELRDEYRVNVVPVEKAPGSVEHGIKYLQDLEGIVIDPARCPMAAKEFINYALNTDRYGDVISKYPDRENHSIDCARYLLSLQISQERKERRQNKFKVRRIPIISRWG